MSTEPEKNEANSNSYVMDSESPMELARLLHQDRLFTKVLGLLPALSNTSKLRSILDVACGPGGWTREAAIAFPSAQVTGIDISTHVIEFAQAQAETQQMTNVHFTVMNALNTLDFPDNSFDLVHGRLLNGFLPLENWPLLLRECKRILRPDGVICLTEAEWGISNSPVSERFSFLLTQAMYRAKHTISPYGFGTTVMLQPFLRQAGYQDIQAEAHYLEYSAGTEAHDPVYQDILAMASLLQPFLLSQADTTQEELNDLYQQLQIEMNADDFSGMWFFLSAWGKKPKEA